METRTTLKQVNKAIAHMGAELVRGAGYYYVVPSPDATEAQRDAILLADHTGIYTPRITDQTVERWVEDVAEIVKED